MDKNTTPLIDETTEPHCPFCHPDKERIVFRSPLALAIEDGFPVNPGHMLIVPTRHVPTWFDASPEEQAAMLALMLRVRQHLTLEVGADGFNIGMNVGRAAGQTVMHVHIHVIPRFSGDVDDPTGGVRLVIPERGSYHHPGRIPRVPSR